MEKRAYERISSNIRVAFDCSNTSYFGTVTNLSRNGMFIKMREISFPFDMKFNITLQLNEKTISIPVNVRRITTSPFSVDGLGVELSDPGNDYLKYIDNLSTHL